MRGDGIGAIPNLALRRSAPGDENRYMFNAIVVGTDGSESAGVAVHKAATLAGLTGGTLHIVCAYRPVSIGNVAMAASAGAATLDVDAVNRSVITEAELIADHAASEARRGGVKVEVHAIPGDAADVLVGVAKEIGADLLVVGNRGMSGKRRFVLGSVPNKVSHHAPCALLIVDTVDQ
jgi:nucleotide-binding universal stress UspA family protein